MNLGIPQPPGATVQSVAQALTVAQRIGYPVVVRPSYVLGGRAMEIVRNATELIRYLTIATEVTPERQVLVDHYMEGRECEVDAICDGETALIPGIMEHVERAGVHSGDSMAIYPGLNLTEAEVDTLVDYTTRIGLALGVRGLMNIQFVLQGGSAYRSPSVIPPEGEAPTTAYVLEVNPRGSRTIPFISKVTGVPVANLATRVMLGAKLRDLGYEGGLWPRQRLVGIKAPVFSMSKLVGVDWYMGPEMKSTGEVMGIDRGFYRGADESVAGGQHRAVGRYGGVVESVGSVQGGCAAADPGAGRGRVPAVRHRGYGGDDYGDGAAGDDDYQADWRRVAGCAGCD